ncbi:hypothetical protein BOX15_Mlig034530g1 [Macrostomum lignano]|uniref:Tetraspanin n=1 Tax=Macrostomum lignano TaxID=282301 RepID=A0A267DQU4_9PLAT|nr:hypothetical protein BOX15_Mlig034530g1 [Macrostomum lignano]
MASDGPLACCRVLCCVFIVFVNIISIIFGVLFSILGILLLVGSSLIQSMSSTAASDGGNQTVSMFGSHVNVSNYYSSLSVLSGSMAGVLIGLGIVIVIVSCIGCFGACIGVPACLIIYVVCVSLLFLGQVVVIIMWFVNSNIFKQGTRDSLQVQVSKFKGDRGDDVDSASLSMVQAMFGCCGVDNGTDFHVGSPNWNRSYTLTDKNNRTFTFNLTYPVTCCKFHLNNYTLIDPYCPYNGSRDPTVSNSNIGCHGRVWEVIDTQWQLNRFFYGLCGTLGLQILLIIGALVIFTVKRQEQQASRSAHAEVEYKMVRQNI